MPRPPRLSTPESQQRAKNRAAKKRVRQRSRRRKRIMSQLVDPLTAALYERIYLGSSEGQGNHVPPSLVPTRKLRARVAELNLQVAGMQAGAFAEAPPMPPRSETAAEADEPPMFARRTSRRRGRQPDSFSPYPQLPFMTDQRQSLDHILGFLHAEKNETVLGRRRRCPFCYPNHDLVEREGPPTLTVYPTGAGDLVFRCHRCGYCLDSVEFCARTSGINTLPVAAEHLFRAGVLTKKLPPAQLAGYERLACIRQLMREGQARYHRLTASDCQSHPVLGTALIYTFRLRELFADRRLPPDMAEQCLARISCDLYGRPSALHLYTVRFRTPLVRLELRDWEAPASITVFLPPWANEVELNRLLLPPPSSILFGQVAEAVQGWPPHERIAVAEIERCSGCWHEPCNPFSVVWAVVRGQRSGSFALPFCAPGEAIEGAAPRVVVYRLPELIPATLGENDPTDQITPAAFRDPERAPEVVDNIARSIAVEQAHQSLVPVLAEVFAMPGIHRVTRHQLLENLSAKTGMTPSELVGDGQHPWTGGPYALNATGGVTYVAKEGMYWRRGRREPADSAVTNFVVRLGGCDTSVKGRTTHRLGLEVGGRSTKLAVTSATLNNSKRLYRALTDASATAEIDYPVVSDPKAKRLLSELIKATQPNGSASNSILLTQ